MMYRVSASVSGLNELKRAIDQAPAMVEQELRGVVSRGAHFARNRISDNAPRRYGALAASFHVEGPTGKGLAVEAKVGTNITKPPYPYFQEVGTGIYGPNGTPITPKAKPFLVFKGRDGHWIRTKSVKSVKSKWYVQAAWQATTHVFNADLKRTVTRIIGALAK